MKLTSEEIAGLAIGAATAGLLLSEDEGVIATVPTIPYITAAGAPANIRAKIRPHLTTIEFTLAGIPFPAVLGAVAKPLT